MTKSEFVDKVAHERSVQEGRRQRRRNAVISTIETTLSRGGEVTFTGFGKFHVAERGAREGATRVRASR